MINWVGKSDRTVSLCNLTRAIRFLRKPYMVWSLDQRGFSMASVFRAGCGLMEMYHNSGGRASTSCRASLYNMILTSMVTAPVTCFTSIKAFFMVGVRCQAGPHKQAVTLLQFCFSQTTCETISSQQVPISSELAHQSKLLSYNTSTSIEIFSKTYLLPPKPAWRCLKENRRGYQAREA